MFIVSLIPGLLAALVHVYIFVLESVLWTGPTARRIFGTTEDEARVTRPLALNQGFYNLFLALVTGVGLIYQASGWTEVGTALMLAGTGSMLAAAVVLAVSSPDKRRSAAIQGVFPLITVVLLLVALLG